MQIGILEPYNFSSSAIIKLKSIGKVIEYNGEHLERFLSGLDVLFVRLGYYINNDFLEGAESLKWLCSPTTGINHINQESLNVRNIKLISLRGERSFLETIRATPEHTFGLILALLRRYVQVFQDTQEGNWRRDKFKGEELYENKIGIIGLGRVGYRIAKYCDSFGASIYWYDPENVIYSKKWIRSSSIDELIESSNIIILCASYENKSIINRKQVEIMSGKYFVNTSRGELVDETSLIDAVANNRLKGVAIDVFSNENFLNGISQWRTIAVGRNVILTPHLAGATIESMEKTENFIAEKLINAIHKLEN